MQRKAILVIASLLMIALLLMVACNPKPTSTTTTTTSTKTTTQVTKTTVSSDKPQYGGTYNVIGTGNLEVWGPAVNNRFGGPPYMWEQVTYGDRNVGPAGSGEHDYTYGMPAMSTVIGCLAEKWSTPKTDTWVLDIRQGIHFSLNPDFPASKLVNGREMTADDVVASLEFMRDTPSSCSNGMEPTLMKNMTVEKTGPWQVTVHTPVSPNTAYLWLMGGGGAQFIWPREWLEKYGLGNEWKEQVGTGPYFVTDWVTNSVLSLKRNDNYWEKNPIGPGKGDQLPYMEAIKYHIIPDTSTRLASMRTGKADMMSTFFSFAREDALSLLQTNPEMKYVKVLTDPLQIGFRIDKADLPFKDLQVRRALSMAIDRPGILAGYYAGDGELLDSPARKLYPSIYTPINELPETAQELFEYNPDQAKKLLADAGYPDGFKTKVICMSDDTSINMAEIIKEDWSKVGVELEIQPKEGGVFWSIWGPRNFEELMLTASCGGNGVMWVRYSFGYYRGPNAFNISRADDPIGSDPTIEAAFLAQEKVINVDFAECDRLMKNLIPYLIDKVFLIQMPAPYGYRLWQPWIKNYYGEGVDKISIQYMWIDRDLKEKMTGRR